MQNPSEPRAEAPRFGTLLAATVALIVYGSTYPWDFANVAYLSNPLWRLLHTWPISFDRWMYRDVVLNLVLYVPVGAFAYLKLARSLAPWVAAILTVALGTALSASLEMVQQFEASRTSSAVDLVCNMAGTAAGVVAGRLHRARLARWASVRLIEADPQGRGALLLVLLWAGYQLLPVFPALSSGRLIRSVEVLVQHLGPPDSSAIFQLLAGLAEWIAVACVSQGLSSGLARAGFPVSAMTMLVCLVPCRLLIAGRTVTLPELLAPAAAWPLWTLWLSKQTARTPWAAGCAVAAILIRGLTPLEFSAAAQPFSWIPLAASLSYEYLAAAIILFPKAFLYGAAIWLLHASGIGRLAAAAAIATLLGAIEAAQIFLPAHTPEITDPLLALLLAGVFALLGAPAR